MRAPNDAIPTVPDYELIRPIGSGNYGQVWLGRNILGSLRAIKVVHRSRFLDDRPYDREYAGMMKYEPLSRGHPGLVSVLHVGRNSSERYFYYIMDLADDLEHGRHIQPESYQPRTLRGDLTRAGRLPGLEAVRIGMALCSALGHLHRHGVVHRDIKPSNIIFVENEPKFADIGLVEDIGEAGTFVGSEGYTPPEGPGKPTADLYGLGKVLYEIVTGLEQPRFPQLPEGFDTLPDAAIRRQLHELTRKACEFNPRRRFQTAAEMYRQLEQFTQTGLALPPPSPSDSARPPRVRRLVVVGDTTSPQPAALAQLLERDLPPAQFQVFVDRPTGSTIEHARQIEEAIANADVVLALLSVGALRSEMLAYELQLALAEAQQHDGRPVVLPLLIDQPGPPPPDLRSLLDPERVEHWPSPLDPAEGLRLVRTALQKGFAPPPAPTPPPRLESVGGAVPLESGFYLTRAADAAVREAVEAGECLVLIKGSRQMGKTSLLARGLQQARESSMRVALTDLQQLNATSFESLDNFYFALANSLADTLELPTPPEATWSGQRSPNRNFEHYLRDQALAGLTHQLVWGIDELDRLLPCAYGGEVFSLFRSWHNRRALDPSTPWSRLTLLMAYATEAHLFIQDLSQSPFNVGTRVALEDFSPDQVGELNRLHGSPLTTQPDLSKLIQLVGGQPYLVRRSLHDLTSRRHTFESFQAEAEKEDGIFGDHLRRLLMMVAKDSTLVEAMRRLNRGEPCPTPEAFYRLRAAGVVAGNSVQDARPRCLLYARFLQRHL